MFVAGNNAGAQYDKGYAGYGNEFGSQYTAPRHYGYDQPTGLYEQPQYGYGYAPYY